MKYLQFLKLVAFLIHRKESSSNILLEA
uniref:Uncharacterized protein n=1 Tax=Anguilla anguilla TaxID=7936 RepID=A0A0E9TN13_ANGAN